MAPLPNLLKAPATTMDHASSVSRKAIRCQYVEDRWLYIGWRHGESRPLTQTDEQTAQPPDGSA